MLDEGVPDDSIRVTGNTVIDALLDVAARVPAQSTAGARRRILMTAHRRENFGKPLEEVFEGIRELVEARPDIEIVYPVHPNPNVSVPARRILGGLPQVVLSEPLGYRALVAAMKRCDLVLTDSGGLQEEAPALGKPVLVLRAATERPEAIEAGVAKAIGTDRNLIFDEVTRLLDDDDAYAAMAVGCSPYGDGHAAERIVTAVSEHMNMDRKPPRVAHSNRHKARSERGTANAESTPSQL
ncbi:MAG: non-hydrolyzing UDP-N-acetylglucosamine 2-epimerase [Alphaproteobacteria bacterium]